MKRIKVMIPGRAEIGVIVKAEVINKVSILTADFTNFKVSAPPEYFQLVSNMKMKGQRYAN